MDSRIREIEQWIEQAKTGLSDGGREEYVKKLFLLDAEIRAVIKENGNIPGVNYSPERRGGGARRSASRLVTAGALASILVLAAAAVWFASPVSRAPQSPGRSGLASSETSSPVLPVRHIPGSISGEEVIVADWIDGKSIELLADAGRADDAAAIDEAAAQDAPVLDIGPALQPGQVIPASMQGGGQPVMLAVGNRDQAGNPVQFQQAAYSALAQAAKGAPRPGSAGVEPVGGERFVAVDIVDNNNPQDPDDVDKLDPDALKRNVEKHFAE